MPPRDRDEKKRNDLPWSQAPGFKASWQRFKVKNPGISDAMTAFDRAKRAVPPEPLPAKMKDHKLDGPLKGFMDCHLDDDVILIYKLQPDRTIKLLRVCEHADLAGPKAKDLKKRIK